MKRSGVHVSRVMIEGAKEYMLLVFEENTLFL